MYKLFVIAKNNMKRQKGDMITFFILTFLAAFLIFDCASAIVGIENVLDDKFREVNGAHILLYHNDTVAENRSAEKVFEENEHIVDYEETPMLGLIAGYRKKGERSFKSFNFYAESFYEEKRIMDVKKPAGNYKWNDILIPYNLKNTFAIGDIMQLKLDDDIYDLHVAGYLEDPYFCSTMNISLYSICLHPDLMEELADDHPYFAARAIGMKGIASEAELQAGYTTAELEKEIEDAYKEELKKYEGDHTGYLLVNWQMMRGGSEFLPLIVIASILVFALLILIIAIVIISFSINNFIRRNMKNTGILEACGYTVGELRWSLTIQTALVSLIGSVTGVAVGVLSFSSFGNIISMVLGLSWNQNADGTLMVVTVIGIVLLIALVTRLISRTYNRISVLDALRGGINTHNFRRNFFSFEHTPLPIPVVMALKDTFGGIGRNLVMVFIIVLLAVSTLVGFGMYENFGTDPDTIMKLMSVEVGNAYVSDNTRSIPHEELSAALKELDGVYNVLAIGGFSPTDVSGNKEQTVSTNIYDDMNNTTSTQVLEGRMPETDNEVMITSGVAKDLNLKVGDVLEIKYADLSEDYLVVGINQAINNMGRSQSMTIEGAVKLIPGGRIVPDFYVYAKDGVNYSKLETEILEMADDEGYDLSLVDMSGMVAGTVDSVVLAMKLLCIIIVFITIFVVIFVESLVIRAKISREWRGMGVSKAIGQTTGGLVLQIMLSNLPAILLGTAIGVMLSEKMGSKLICTMFSMFEMNNVVFKISPVWMILTVVGILLIAVLTAGFEGLKVKRLIPVEMITEE